MEEGKSISVDGTASTSYRGRQPASMRASAAARGSSKKSDTECEVLLRRTLWAAGYRFRKNTSELPGNPDIVFPRAKLIVFCDGDFWHGRDWEVRRQRLSRGANADYWIAKIQRNIEHDLKVNWHLEGMGWKVLRFWESDIKTNYAEVATMIIRFLDERVPRKVKAEHNDV